MAKEKQEIYYLYINHMSDDGTYKVSKHKMTEEECYCEGCKKSDIYLGEFTNDDELKKLLYPRYNTPYAIVDDEGEEWFTPSKERVDCEVNIASSYIWQYIGYMNEDKKEVIIVQEWC